MKDKIKTASIEAVFLYLISSYIIFINSLRKPYIQKNYFYFQSSKKKIFTLYNFTKKDRKNSGLYILECNS